MNTQTKKFFNKKEKPAQLLKLKFAVYIPKRASYLLSCLGIYIRHHRQQEVDTPVLEKNPWNAETNQQARTPTQCCLKQE